MKSLAHLRIHHPLKPGRLPRELFLGLDVKLTEMSCNVCGGEAIRTRSDGPEYVAECRVHATTYE